MYFRNGVAVEVPEKLMEYRGKWEETEYRNYVEGTVMHLARLNACTECVVTTMDIRTERNARGQTSFQQCMEGTYCMRYWVG